MMMFTDERCKELMNQLGMPNSRSLMVALKQVANEVEQKTLYKNDTEIAKLKRLMQEAADRYNILCDARGYITQRDVALLTKLRKEVE